MVKIILVSILFSSCYTVLQKRDDDFINQIKQQQALDSTLKTTIELNPAKVFFGNRKNSDKLTGSFYIKNNGSQDFNLLTIKANCHCIDTDYTRTTIGPNDSLKISYIVDLKNKKGVISNTIVAIGNCQYGNQTFLIEGTIIN